ncbi:unnamed protein product [Bursaphelenchus xylophilus]|uniref:(pine wood nematode) hypothetical protein n=1 Tax=Bursaphelenchus xylophilus TaxID=6326 RepID=A0A7I8XDM0_BURXY|nr:unnamed protein product [Bursaphelenchus xylophilus]CAG9113686.1 unnamed protein product [Bursaphelenchus xylophilus]
MGWLRCEIDQKMVDVQIDKKLEEYGLLPNIKTKKENVTETIDTNSTKEMIEQLRQENKTRKESDGKGETEKKKEFRVPSIVLVMLTTFGRIFNVVGTMKMFQAFTSYISARRRKNLRTTTERLSGGEGEGEWSEAMMECCTLCAA